MKKILLLLLVSLSLSQCECDDNVTKKEALPEATQEGKNTIGCYLNNELWLPREFDGRVNPSASYDPGYAGGSLSIYFYKYKNDSIRYLSFGASELESKSFPSIINFTDFAVTYSNDNPDCSSYYNAILYGTELNSNNSAVVRGVIVLNKLDKQNQIVAGTFNFLIINPACDTIEITEGRFDLKF